VSKLYDTAKARKGKSKERTREKEKDDEDIHDEDWQEGEELDEFQSTDFSFPYFC